MHYRTLDNGEVDFCTERSKQKARDEAGKEARSIEDIGPQEEGESATVHVVIQIMLFKLT